MTPLPQGSPFPLDTGGLRILHYPEPVLRSKADPVGQITAEVRQVAQRLLELMREAPGVGLAAPQVGLSWRMFVANPSGEMGNDTVFINPVLSDFSTEVADKDEGCLSLPEVWATIRRPKAVTISALDVEGRSFHRRSDEQAARVWQHECDHLDGVLILDRMTPLDRKANRKVIAGLKEIVSNP